MSTFSLVGGMSVALICPLITRSTGGSATTCRVRGRGDAGEGSVVQLNRGQQGGPLPPSSTPAQPTSGAMYSTVPTGEMADSCRMLMVSPKSPCGQAGGQRAEVVRQARSCGGLHACGTCMAAGAGTTRNHAHQLDAAGVVDEDVLQLDVPATWWECEHRGVGSRAGSVSHVLLTWRTC